MMKFCFTYLLLIKNNEENKKFLNDAEIADVIPSDYIFIIFFLGYPASPIIDILCLTQVCLFVCVQ